MKLQMFRVFNLFSNSGNCDILNRGHSSSASSILAPRSWNFSRFQPSPLLLVLPHLPASFGSADPNSAFGGEQWSFPTCCSLLIWPLPRLCETNRQTHARPPCGSSLDAVQHNVENQLRMLTSATFIWPPASNRVYRFRAPPQPNQVTSHFPAVSERTSDGTRPNRPDGCFSSYLFMCLFLPPFLPLPP